MNISVLAHTSGVSTDTVRYYEKQGLLQAAQRQENGYRTYTQAHVEMLRFVRGAQGLGFSLTEIQAILPQLASGNFGRTAIEQQLQTKISQIDAHIRQLQTLKKELKSTFAALTCTPDQVLSPRHGTPDIGASSGPGPGAKMTSLPAKIARRQKPIQTE
jgi:MerR family copper efflux transcriptional regulator